MYMVQSPAPTPSRYTKNQQDPVMNILHTPFQNGRASPDGCMVRTNALKAPRNILLACDQRNNGALQNVLAKIKTSFLLNFSGFSNRVWAGPLASRWTAWRGLVPTGRTAALWWQITTSLCRTYVITPERLQGCAANVCVLPERCW